MITKIVFILGFLFFFQWSIYSEANVDFYRIVQSISVTGNNRISFPDSQEHVRFYTRRGRRINKVDLIKDINQLYLLGWFQSIQAFTTLHGDDIDLVFKVKENPKVRVISFQGNHVFSDSQLRPLFSQKLLFPFNNLMLKDDQETLTSYYHTKGYSMFEILDTQYRHEELIVNVSEGNVKDVILIGLKNIQPFVVLRELDVKKGSVFNYNYLLQDRTRLLRLGYFLDVSTPKIEQTTDRHSAKLVYRFEEKKSNTINLGLETGRQSETYGFVRLDHNHFLLHTDLISGKIQVGLNQTDGFKIQNYSIHYSQPWLFNTLPISFGMDFWNRNRLERLSFRVDPLGTIYTNHRYGGAISLGRYFINRALNVSSKVTIERVQPVESGPFNINPYSIHSLGARIKYTTLENIYNPKQGFYCTFDVEKGLDVTLGAFQGLSFYRMSLDGAVFFNVLTNTTLGLHGFMGRFKPDNTSFNTFESEGYQIGGVATLRGYKETLYLIGDRKIQLNAELRYDFSSFFQGVFFYDIGNIFDEGDFPETYLKGSGIGARLFTPIGPIRLDFSWKEGRFFSLQDTIVHAQLGQLF